MNVVVPCEERFVLHQGRPASRYLGYDKMWKRYLDVFDGVTVVARLFETEDAKAQPVEGPGVRLAALSGYTGPLQYLTKRQLVARQVRAAFDPEAAYILRVPGTIGTLMWRVLRQRHHPFAVEMVGDPYEVFAPGSVRHPLRRAFRYWIPRLTRQQCHEAFAAAYVTERVLQGRYPCPGFCTGISSLTMPDEALVSEPRQYTAPPSPATIAMVGHFNQLYKAPQILLQAAARAMKQGLDLRLVLVGEGSYLGYLQSLAGKLGIATRVEFTGGLPSGVAVREVLDRADVFVLASFQEGLPRAMIEAMARALPCVGSTAGGIPELLAEEDLVPPGDAQALARKLFEVLRDPARLERMSRRNLARAQDYRGSDLRDRRVEFYQRVREHTEAWLQSKGTRPARATASAESSQGAILN